MYNKIVLVGMRGSGKSHFGSCLAEEIGWPKIDMDDEIEALCKKKISRIVSSEGWESFRQKEHDIAKKVSQLQNVIISTGGGAITYENNREYLLKDSLVILLFSPLKDLYERIKNDSSRPSLTENNELKKEIEQIWEERKNDYFDNADIVFRAKEFPNMPSWKSVHMNAKILAKRVKKLLEATK